MREVRRYLTSEPPASTAVQVAALVVPDALIEIDLVAVVPATAVAVLGLGAMGRRDRGSTPRRWS